MIAHKWFFCISVLFIIDHTCARKSSRQDSKSQTTTSHMPPKRAMNRPKSKTLEERGLGQEYVEQYQEMMRSQESFENFDESRDEKRLRRMLIGDDDLSLMAEAGGLPRRPRSGQLQSMVGRRRARSEAIRRDKLHFQGVLSHKRHSKPNILENN